VGERQREADGWDRCGERHYEENNFYFSVLNERVLVKLHLLMLLPLLLLLFLRMTMMMI